MARVLCFDIDGVLTEEADTNHEDLAGTYVYRRPSKRARELVLRAYDSGWYVVLYTGRREAHRRITEDWLYAHGFHYHALFMGKPYFTYLVDDRVIGISVKKQLDAVEHLLGGDERRLQAEMFGKQHEAAQDPLKKERFPSAEAILEYVEKHEGRGVKEAHLVQAFTPEFLNDLAHAIHRGSRMSFDTLGIDLPREQWDHFLKNTSTEMGRGYLLACLAQWLRQELMKRFPPLGPIRGEEKSGGTKAEEASAGTAEQTRKEQRPGSVGEA